MAFIIVQDDLAKLPTLPPHSALCLGYFDGVHRGHQALALAAKNAGFRPYVLTFDHTPKYVLGFVKKEEILTSVTDKAEIFAAFGIEGLYVATFNPRVASLTPDEFIALLNRLNPEAVFCGSDYRFGQLAKGDVAYLRSSPAVRFETVVVPEVTDEGIKVATRDLLAEVKAGEMARVRHALGRPYQIRGTVVQGLGNGRKLGYPTANLDLRDPYVLPPDGVYATEVGLLGKRWMGVTYVGTHPTIDPLPHPIVETYILDYTGKIYHQEMTVGFLAYLRGDMTFADLNSLKKQIAEDIAKTRALVGVSESKDKRG